VTEITIHPITMADYGEMIELWRGMPGIGLSSADEQPQIARYLARNPGISFIARAEGRLVGTVLAGHDGRRGYLHHLAVEPAYRGLGIARRLVEVCLEALRTQEIQKCHILVFHENEEGKKFWRRIGWADRPELEILSRNL